jgi:23S rRNA pseudouridine1911/1915/1917 synthase
MPKRNAHEDEQEPEALLIDLDAGEWEEEDEDEFDEETAAAPEQAEGGILTLLPTRADIGSRLDKYVASAAADLSRSYVQQLIDEGNVLVDGQPRRSSFKVTPGETVVVVVPAPEPVEVLPEAIPLDIIYEDRDIIVLDKPAGMVVHPAPGHPRGTLVNALLHHAPEINIGGTNRPGIIHRLDKDTSGVMVVVKTDRARTSLVAQWQARTVDKAYTALVHGDVPEDEASIDVPIGRDPKDRKRMAALQSGREAITHFTVRERMAGATLLDVDLETGRTHQIRVHLAFIGFPIVGDELYNKHGGPLGGKTSIAPRQFLHAARLAFRLPDGTPVRFESGLPADLTAALERVRGGDPG